MGLTGAGLLGELTTLQAQIQTSLVMTNDPQLMLRFTQLQLYTQDFSTSLDMKQADRLLSQTTALQESVLQRTLPPENSKIFSLIWLVTTTFWSS
ncbi:MAG: hypothetical protein HC873_11995 [Leptolyngbyaceae cyanobacterium SL_1_1]|nr:hypothetical protein [Leptolyngbyaceae cyanobacterium SL_1_1]